VAGLLALPLFVLPGQYHRAGKADGSVLCRLVCETTVDLQRPCGSKPVARSITKCKLVYETRVDQEKPCGSKPVARSITSTERVTRISCKTLQIRFLSVILPAPSLLPQGFSWSTLVSYTTSLFLPFICYTSCSRPTATRLFLGRLGITKNQSGDCVACYTSCSRPTATRVFLGRLGITKNQSGDCVAQTCSVLTGPQYGCIIAIVR